jgi:Shugoshin C terminus
VVAYAVPCNLLTRKEPINNDPVVSPRKPKSLDAQKLCKGAVSSTNPALDSVRMRIQERKVAREDRQLPKLGKEKELATANAVEPEQPPITPGLSDLFSPLGLQPSTGRTVSKDTPPPAGLRAISSAEVAGRGSRRARAAVNYAEPSLVSKMRRPTKELVDAVGKDGRPVFGGVVVKEDDDDEDERERVRSQDTAWRPLSSASGGTVAVADEVPSPLSKKSCEDPVLRVSHPEKSTAAAPLQYRKRDASAMGPAESDDEHRAHELSIFDFTSSSPNEKEKMEGRQKSMSRRKSTMLDGSGETAVTENRVRLSARRRSMMV